MRVALATFFDATHNKKPPLRFLLGLTDNERDLLTEHFDLTASDSTVFSQARFRRYGRQEPNVDQTFRSPGHDHDGQEITIDDEAELDMEESAAQQANADSIIHRLQGLGVRVQQQRQILRRVSDKDLAILSALSKPMSTGLVSLIAAEVERRSQKLKALVGGPASLDVIYQKFRAFQTRTLLKGEHELWVLPR